MNSTEYNHLKDEKSAYLLAHKENPVHWHPYGPVALQKAKDQNKPIFLSVGYSSCHWCHVMADESFNDQETADFLNENFVSIKVDREEFPDIDQYYQQACQLFVKTGGWPLNAFLLPDMRPFFVGTYYPLVKRGEGASFMELIKELKRAFDQDREQVETNAANVTKSIKEGLGPKEEVPFQGHFPPPMAILDAIKDFADNENGGYGQAPKFPHFAFYEWAIEQILEGMISQEAGQPIVDSLEKMLMGGLQDHARGGIHRYSTDDLFLVPHFEKMLYDQAGLLKTLAKLSLVFPSPVVFDGLINTLEYLKSEMQDDSGIFFSAQDADSEGVEGLYFTFTYDEFCDLLVKASQDDDLVLKQEEILKWFQITKEGNFQQGLNVISLDHKMKKEFLTSESWDIVRRVRRQVLEERKGRIPPATDTKGIASWNSLMISALIDVMQYCQIDLIKSKASELFNNAMEGHFKSFLLSKDNQGMMLRHVTTKPESLPYLEDFVTFSESMIRVYEITGNPTFKQNFKDTLDFILKEFVKEDQIFTRSINLDDHQLYPNQALSPFDQSFKSMAMTLGSLIKRARILFMEADFGVELNNYLEDSKHFILRNPLNGGEGLRTHSYPEEAYRVVKLPKSWLQNNEFIGFMAYFLPRFVLDYHEGENESWEICTLQQCELKGDGLKSFIQTLRPQSSEQSEG
ncbi:MAG: DUF255 domain-containing protein [Bacteriovoracaceae bacterium]|nr:DUF255 domain-containing protein [Bacteriovoracaceae bacterium]